MASSATPFASNITSTLQPTTKANPEGSKQLASNGVYYIFGFIMIVIFVLGLFMNSLVVIIFRRIYKRTKNTTNLLIVSLSYCNLLHVATYPLNIIASFQTRWSIGDSACQTDAFFVHFMALTSIAHLVALAMERFLSMTGKTFSKTSVFRVGLVCFCWLYGFFWSVMPLFGWSEYKPEGLHFSCSVTFSSRNTNHMSYVISIFLFNYVIPITLIVFFYSRIYLLIKKHNATVFASKNSSEETASASMEKKLLDLMISMVVAFMLAWTPYAIVCFALIVKSDSVSPFLISAPSIAAKTSVCYFPVLYGLKHSGFKKELRRIISNEPANAKDDTFFTRTHRSGHALEPSSQVHEISVATK